MAKKSPPPRDELDDEHRPTGRRLRIADLMRATAAAALVFGLARALVLSNVARGMVFPFLLSILVVFALTLALQALRRVRCPDCGAPGLLRESIRPFGDRTYRCRNCGARRARTLVGGWRPADPLSKTLATESPPGAGRWSPPPMEGTPSTPIGRLLAEKPDRVQEAEMAWRRHDATGLGARELRDPTPQVEPPGTSGALLARLLLGKRKRAKVEDAARREQAES